MLVSDIIELNALKWADRRALVVDDGTFSFGELHERTLRLASALRTLTVPGARVAILSENRVEYVDAYYGVPRAGMTLVFLNYRLTPHELAWITNDASATVLIVEGAYLQRMLDVRDEMPSVEHVVVIGGVPAGVSGALDYDELVVSAPIDRPGPRPSEADVAWQVYTSGTTGRPKGAMLSHRSLLAAVYSTVIAFEVGSDHRHLLCFPMCHMAGSIVPVAHLVGCEVVLMRGFGPEPFMELVERHRITDTALAPTMMSLLLQHPRVDDFDLSSLSSISYGGSGMPVAVLQAALARFGPVVSAGFGMTETAGNVVVHSKQAHVRAAQGEEHLLAACGVPMPLAAVRVVDEAMNEQPPGEVGEIVVRGEQVMTGYGNRPEDTEEAFRGGWYHTGDVAWRDDEGFLYLVDRKKDMIITGGENVYTREVEDVLYAIDGVSEAAVIGLPDETWGELVTAVIARREGADLDEQAVVSACRQHLAGFKTPRRVLFVDEIPKNVSGKVLKRELRARFAAPPP